MFFSIVIPVYNVEQYLHQCIDSILNQTFTNYEIILIDDGSHDSSPVICDEYANQHSNITVIHKTNGGLSDARNTGVKAAHGEYLCFLDSDDYWCEDDALEEYWALLSKAHADILRTGNMISRSSNGTILVDRKTTFSKYSGMNNQQVLTGLIESGNLSISACSLIVSRQFFVRNSLFFKPGIKSEDIEWALRLYQCNPTWTFSDRNIYVYRSGRSGSITSTMDYKHLSDYMTTIEDAITRINNSCDKSLKKPLISYLMYHQLILMGLIGRTKLTDIQKKNLNERCRSICKKYLCKYREDPRVKKTAVIYKCGGYGTLQAMLTFYLNHRGR